jgi:hypothetical protein
VKVSLELPNYSLETGVPIQWQGDFSISTSGTADCFVLKANKAGLISLAIQLLTLAQDDVPVNCHIHYDEFNSLEDDLIELVIQKTD